MDVENSDFLQFVITAENSSNSARLQMLHLFLFVCFVLIRQPSKAQFDVNGCLDKHFTKRDNIEWLLTGYKRIYDFHKQEKLASVGAGSGVREIIYSMMDDSISFYLQDINPVCLQPEDLALTIRQVYQIAGRVSTATFIPIRGKEKETRLPERFFDKIIIENSLHEFTYPNEMLTSIRGNLKKEGYLFIWELIARRPGQKHKGCRKPLFTEESLLKLLDENGFSLTEKTVVDPHYQADRVYKFALKY
ncbi:hypothetical protein [Larkinella terrae]|uniref:Methyltransferase domain-containing protein n=1 Tax=Larkinella terrae TaxID=2025311 RepID=A0A7K0EMW3_9BACT|nr:hypothetical protein [Larkinella terrae]MRS63062.1 hypothetical protein [Larkinella terrae]